MGSVYANASLSVGQKYPRGMYRIIFEACICNLRKFENVNWFNSYLSVYTHIHRNDTICEQEMTY